MWRNILATLAVGFVAVGGGAAAIHFYSRPAELRVAVAQGDQDFRLMNAAAQALSLQREPVRLKIIPVRDAAESAAELEKGAVDLAVVRSDGRLPPTSKALLILHRNAALLVAPGGSSLRRVADLRGKRIGVVQEGRDVEADVRLLGTILTHYEVAQKSVSLFLIRPGEIRSAIEARRIDILFVVGVANMKAMTDLVGEVAATSAKPPVFVPISEAKAIAKRFPLIESVEVLRGAFGGEPPRPAEEFDSSSVSVLLVARNSLDNSAAAEVTRQLFANRAAIAVSTPLANNIEAPSTEKGSALPVHPGAADFLEGNEDSFLDKYSDFFYLGAMLLSLVGSAAAAVAGRLNLRTRERSQQTAERLLEILRASRVATRSEELDRHEREVDEVLVNSLADVRRRNVAASELHMVSLALDQARLAIRERRRALASSGEIVNFPRRTIKGRE